MSFNQIEYKKPFFKIQESLNDYLVEYSRSLKIPLQYEDLLRYSGLVPLENEKGEPTLWNRVIFNSNDMDFLYSGLVEIYRLLISDGSKVDHLTVDGVDFCGYGNSKPFRIKILNQLNDNYDYYYIKIADASRVYGLELEHHFSPNKINYIYYQNSLIEEHIIGIPGDQFIKEVQSNKRVINEVRLSKEFVKFNEQCFVRLLGDMRSYNYVIVVTQDFDQIQYRVRAIDFDQQCFEGKLSVYRPQFFKENYPLMLVVKDKLNHESIIQYKIEERSIVSRRLINSGNRIDFLVNIMKKDPLSIPENLEKLKNEIFVFTKDDAFTKSKSMGELMQASFDYMRRNYQNVSLGDLL